MLRVDPTAPDPDTIAEAAALLRAGGLVAFPTETVYGLGANALDAGAVARIFAAKGRPADDPLIVHVAEPAGLDAVAGAVPPVAVRLAAAFWPGPLTLVVPRGAAIPSIVTAGGPTVGVRMPAHPVALALIAAAGVPVAAPSANPFGRTSPTIAAHVAADLGDRVDLILDGGPCAVGIESTVVDCTSDPPAVLRPGGISLEALRVVVPEMASAIQTAAPLRSPGEFVRHYAPRARMVLVTGRAADDDRATAVVACAGAALAARGVAVGVLAYAGDAVPEGVRTATLGPAGDAGGVARRLFAALRALDAAGCDVILVRDIGPVGLGLAVRDRLNRAAEGRAVDPLAIDDPTAGVERAVAAVVRLASPP